MKQSQIKPPIVVFDLDGTLVHTAPDLVASMNHALVMHGQNPIDYSELAPFAGTGGRGMLKRYGEHHKITFSEPEIVIIISRFLAHYEAEMPGKSVIYEDAIGLVEALRDAGFKTAICTNKPQKLADLLLQKLGIFKHFDAICGADYFAFRKPDPRHLIETIKVAGGNVSRAILFGDSQTDFDTANSANIPVVGVTFGYSPEPISNFKITKLISHYRDIDAATIEGLLKV